MWLRAWLLWAGLLHTWAECARHAEHKGLYLCLAEQGSETQGSKGRRGPKERAVGASGPEHQHHHAPPHEGRRTLRRKGWRVRAEDEWGAAPRILHHPSDVVVEPGSPATLSCRAEGTPKPSIQWLRNGQRVEKDRWDVQSQPMVLSDGSLFFLSVGGGGRRGQTHEGVYTCLARNSVGMAMSRNASLYIGVLRDEFVVQPDDVEVDEGEAAVLRCSPPIGHPEPSVTWMQNGLPVNTSDTHYTEREGTLTIAPSGKKHSGVYVCVASNPSGVRKSRAAQLIVLARPRLLQRPENVTVRPGESATFYCQARGDPAPVVQWSREQGPLPNGRYLVSPDQSLQVHYVTVQDEGRYTCTATNDRGQAAASAHLIVEDASNTKQKDLHKELSALRVDLENITILAPASNMAHVQWKLQSLPSKPHYLDGFEVLFRSLLPAGSDWEASKVALPSFQAQAGPLKRGYKYEFKVRPYGGDLYGRESNNRQLRVPEMAPSAPPSEVSITVDRDQNNMVHLSWQPPASEAQNGVIQGYQVWCVELPEERYQNWTVDSGRHRLEISTLAPDKRYSVTVAAVNGAGVGTHSQALGFYIEPERRSPSETGDWGKDSSPVLSVLRNPLLIASACALLWCILMTAALCLYRRHSGSGFMGSGRKRSKGLHRLASEDLIIKHRMATPDSPWMSGAWRPMHCNTDMYKSLWAGSPEGKAFNRGSSLPVMSNKEPGYLDSSVRIVPDSCGVYGTFYVDLMGGGGGGGGGLKTFNSPARRPRMQHGPAPEQQQQQRSEGGGGETICITGGPVAMTTPPASRGALPWKQAVPPRPRMGVQREPWERSQSKQELHAVKSVPLLSSNHLRPAHPAQRAGHLPPRRPAGAHPEVGSPRTLHYTTSLHLVDMLPSPPPPPPQEDALSLSSDEGSSRSTRLTGDMGSLQSLPDPEADGPSYSRQSTASYCASLDKSAMTSQEATQYLELGHTPETRRQSEQPAPTSPHGPFSPDLGFVYGPAMAEPQGTDHRLHHNLSRRHDDPPATTTAPGPNVWRRARLWSTPSSCYSETDGGSVWSTWGSLTEGSGTVSARTSMVSSVDGSSISDANFARFMTLASGGSISGASMSDFSPPASPLSGLFPPFYSEGDPTAERAPVPAWEWNMAWLEEMEARYRAQCPGQKPFNA